MMMKSLFLVGLMITSALAEGSRPNMAALHVQPNFDFSLANREFRVQYSGVGQDFSQATDAATIKIYKKDVAEAVHSFEVLKKNAKKAYYFALDKTADGEYEVEVCSGTSCSGKNPALTEIKTETYKLTCEQGKGHYQKDKQGEWKKEQNIELDFKGPLSSDWIPKTKFTEIEDELNQAIKASNPTSTETYTTDFTRLNLGANPTYKQQGKTLYAAVEYNIAQYKDLFDKKRGEDDARTTYTHNFCKRKYLLSAHVHLVDIDTKEIKYRFKTTLFLSGAGKYYYILDPKATNRKVPVEMTYENVDIDDGKYRLHVIFCATEKDSTDSTFCADPITKDLTISSSSEA